MKNRHYTKQAHNYARILRSEQTNTEKVLWYNIRNNKLNGIKFKRQVPIGKYIVDFLCMHKKLVIELDGSQHVENQEYDNIRTEYLKSNGYTVIRFFDDEVLKHTENVLTEILRIYDSL